MRLNQVTTTTREYLFHVHIFVHITSILCCYANLVYLTCTANPLILPRGRWNRSLLQARVWLKTLAETLHYPVCGSSQSSSLTTMFQTPVCVACLMRLKTCSIPTDLFGLLLCVVENVLKNSVQELRFPCNVEMRRLALKVGTLDA